MGNKARWSGCQSIAFLLSNICYLTAPSLPTLEHQFLFCLKIPDSKDTDITIAATAGRRRGGRAGRQFQPKLIFYTNLIKTDVIIGVGSLPLPCQSQSNGQEAVIIILSDLISDSFLRRGK